MLPFQKLMILIDEYGTDETRKIIQVSTKKLTEILETKVISNSTRMRISKGHGDLIKSRELKLKGAEDPELDELDAFGQKRAGSKIYRSGTQQITDSYLW